MDIFTGPLTSLLPDADRLFDEAMNEVQAAQTALTLDAEASGNNYEPKT